MKNLSNFGSEALSRAALKNVVGGIEEEGGGGWYQCWHCVCEGCSDLNTWNGCGDLATYRAEAQANCPAPNPVRCNFISI